MGRKAFGVTEATSGGVPAEARPPPAAADVCCAIRRMWGFTRWPRVCLSTSNNAGHDSDRRDQTRGVPAGTVTARMTTRAIVGQVRGELAHAGSPRGSKSA
jgi:hypothetical protein